MTKKEKANTIIAHTPPSTTVTPVEAGGRTKTKQLGSRLRGNDSMGGGNGDSNHKITTRNHHSVFNPHLKRVHPHHGKRKFADDIRRITLALQGGGAHGAYTWGVLDRLLEDERIEIESVSGTSAGGMNAALLVDGYIKNGRQGAKDALAKFWVKVAEIGQMNPLTNSPLQGITHNWNLDSSPMFAMYDLFSRLFSPYQINPLNINPLKSVVEEMMDFKALQKSDLIPLFITATSIETGQPHIFHHKEITSDALMASACLPTMFQAVSVEDHYYWDGGFAGNPSIWPLAYISETSDIVVVEINPVVRKEIPRNANEITNRVNEISFNASLIAEIKSIHFINQLIEENHISSDIYRKLHIHLIRAADEMLDLNASSKMNTSLDFIQYLHKLGRKSAEKWIKHNFKYLGDTSSIDIHDSYLKHIKHPFWRKMKER